MVGSVGSNNLRTAPTAPPWKQPGRKTVWYPTLGKARAGPDHWPGSKLGMSIISLGRNWLYKIQHLQSPSGMIFLVCCWFVSCCSNNSSICLWACWALARPPIWSQPTPLTECGNGICTKQIIYRHLSRPSYLARKVLCTRPRTKHFTTVL